MLKVPFVALDLQQRAMKAEIVAAIERVLDHGQYILGPDVQDFERRFATLCGVPTAVGTDNGTSALILTLRALKIGRGDEVITAPNSFVASAAAISLTGARPVFVDVRDDLNIDPGLIEGAITPHTRAVLPIHLTGRPAAMDPICALADRFGLVVVEDAAQAVGAKLNGRAVGGLGTAGCFSLHPLKNLGGCGDGGVITTRDPALGRALTVARNHGLRNRDECEAWSYNCRLDTLQAAILNVKLGHLDRWTAAKRRLAGRYQQALAGVVQVPVDRPEELAVYQTYVIRADRRDELQKHLALRGIDSKIHYPIPIHLQPAAVDLGHKPGAFPVAERLAGEILSLPLYPELTQDQQDAVVEGVLSFYRGPGR